MPLTQLAARANLVPVQGPLPHPKVYSDTEEFSRQHSLIAPLLEATAPASENMLHRGWDKTAAGRSSAWHLARSVIPLNGPIKHIKPRAQAVDDRPQNRVIKLEGQDH